MSGLTVQPVVLSTSATEKGLSGLFDRADRNVSLVPRNTKPSKTEPSSSQKHDDNSKEPADRHRNLNLTRDNPADESRVYSRRPRHVSGGQTCRLWFGSQTAGLAGEGGGARISSSDK
ncbi:hypothetical protein Bbelb_121780 [Branchiostoma belcheri]|nr:hypothetical protein Bbelb_121780 [Branchiostoma belcheri]